MSKELILLENTTSISHKKWDGWKRKWEEWDPCGGGAAKRVKNGCLVPWLYLSRHIWL